MANKFTGEIDRMFDTYGPDKKIILLCNIGRHGYEEWQFYAFANGSASRKSKAIDPDTDELCRKFSAECDVRKFIASKIDECVDANTNKKALKVREWDEYQPYAPMKRKDYEERKRQLKKQLKEDLAELETEWNTRGKNNPNFHKI